jgi:hypothetical protein
MRRQLLQGSAMRRQLLQLCLPWPRLPRHGCFLSVSWASNQPRECRGEPRDEISVQSANYLPDIRLLSTANPFKSLLLMQKCVLLASVTPKPERARALKKRLFWMSITRYGSRGVATGVSDAPPGAFSTHGLIRQCRAATDLRKRGSVPPDICSALYFHWPRTTP